jgi:hypothetical protein
MLPDETLLSGAKKTCPARATPHLVQRELVVHATHSTDDRHFEVRLTTKDGNAVLFDYYGGNRVQARITAMRDLPGCRIEKITLVHRANY